jgi:hypothetical protein
MWQALDLADLFAEHDLFVTIGENVGHPNCTVPVCGREWVTTPQPVVLEEWPTFAGAGSAFSSVASWRGAYAPVDYEGHRYGLRVHEFRKFASLPLVAGGRFELALSIDDADSADRDLLVRNGWHLVDPLAVAFDVPSYRAYIQQSAAEVMVAKNMYVDTNSGWLSDRSICYLASGKPVLAQDTGFSSRYPTGEGLLAFSTLDEANAGVADIRSNYSRHARAARAIAEEFFSANRILGRLLEHID